MDAELLADLDELGDEFDDAGAGASGKDTAYGLGGGGAGGDDVEDDEDDDDDDMESEADDEAAESRQAAHNALLESLKGTKDVRGVLKVFGSRQLKDLLQKISGFLGRERLPEHNTGPVEEDPEFHALVQANSLIVDLENEVFIRDHYAPRFPELESLVLNPVEYARTVKMIGNEEDLANLDLKSFLPSATIMVITVTATTTNGRQLAPDELARVMKACDVALDLDAARRQIIDYIGSRMGFLAPNLATLLGTGVAAKLMCQAGGLTALSKIPACNILVLGAQKKTNTGLSNISMGKHAGVVYQCDLVQQMPDDLRRKAARLVAAKCALASRVDCARESITGLLGQQYRTELEKKIELILQPPPGKKTKALPVPDDGPRKRRGGRRVRKAKERLAQTDLRKAQNRMAFGEPEEEVGFDGEETIGLGMIGKQTGKVRGIQADKRVKVTVSKRHRAVASHSAHTSGLSSSVAFTPIKGIELENPEIAAQRAKEASTNKYFSGKFFAAPAKK
nr:U4/U6 small nuclear ribonucleoprotein Prp31 [Polyrhizophydium stewartii]